MKKTISVIIPTYNRSKTLRNTIKSLINQSFEKDRYEIIVVDNDSSDDTRSAVEEIIRETGNSLKIRYVFEKNPGVHFARNLGAKLAENEILYFTDDDMEADSRLLEEILKVFSIDERIGTATGLVFPKFQVNPPRWIEEHCQNSILSVNVHLKNSKMFVSKERFGVFNCHQAVTREVFFKTSGVHPENTKGLWVGDGDAGLNEDIKNLGFFFAFTPTAVTFHCIPAERMTQKYINKRIFNQGYADSFSLYRKNRSLAVAFFQSAEHFLRIPYFVAKTILFFVFFNSKWHLTFGQVFYSIARIKYNILLFFNPSARENNLKKSWL